MYAGGTLEFRMVSHSGLGYIFQRIDTSSSERSSFAEYIASAHCLGHEALSESVCIER